MGTAQLADFILYFHIAFILGVIIPVPLILLGGKLGWRWVRNPWVRFSHLAMIAIVVAESLFKVRCPLTVWEQGLRRQVGQQPTEGSFIAYWLHRLFFFHAEPWVFTAIYVAFGLLIVMLWMVYPPKMTRVR